LLFVHSDWVNFDIRKKVLLSGKKYFYNVAPMGLKYILQLAYYHTVAAMQLIEKSPGGTILW
jgi:hypothetical protein